MYLENANVVDFPHVVAKAAFVACEMILTPEWDKVFPGQDMYFSSSDFLGNPTDGVIAKKVLWDVCNMEKYGAPDLYDMKFISITLGNGAAIQMVWRKLSKIYREANGTKDAEWELCTLQLIAPGESNPVVSVDFPKKLTERAPKGASIDELQAIAASIMDFLRGAECHTMFEFTNYHGFGKARFPHGIIADLLSSYGFTTKDVQVELVFVNSDLTREVHLHVDTNAYCVVMGKDVHYPNPDLARTYRDGKWIPLKAGDELAIPTGTKHGFTVNNGGVLYFLSVQSPPIVREDGHEDYVRL